MVRALFYTCMYCGSVNATSYRRKWWRWLSPMHFNKIACPDCRFKQQRRYKKTLEGK